MTNLSQRANFKQFAKFLLLAQTASDAGKNKDCVRSNSASNAVKSGYGLKDRYIMQAIGLAKDLSIVEVSSNWDDSLDMNVVYFDIKGFGQVSFHSFSNFTFLPESKGWDGWRGGSEAVCRKIAKKLNLPFYHR